ncbi:doublecortin domain-containing protein 2-like isoform X4 [Dreissena polymorpha]|uniref:doublecortin domain-containing protein 2-like isoform X4 n=1 Tax=Dreissena polymorpha TaxID=45954 RepID=UPI002263DA4D|nr:doublecortin domain-containing protein 2-like isoform X4 [Dreissena polymorpha]
MSKAYSPAQGNTSQYAPVETRDLKHSPNVVFYVNGDQFTRGSKVCISNRIKTLDGVKEELTKLLYKDRPQVGFVRNIYTPTGGTRLQSLDEFKDGEHYVAALNDRFKPLPYREIPEKTRPPHRKGFKKIDYDVTYTPVQHALEERLRHKSGRSYYLNEHRRGLRLRVHVNGENERPYCPVSIRYKDRENFIKILEEIERTLQLQPIEKVYKVINQGGKSENFTEITDAEHLEQDEHVLVLPKNEKKLQADKIYHLDGKKNFRVGVSPRHGPAYNFPSFPDFDAGFKHNKSLNKHRPLPSIGSSQKGSEPISPFSNPPNSQGSRQRSKGRTPKQADYDQDAGGVYRAKKQNNAKGAAMVNETNDTHIERPIDQMEAEVVDEEEDIKEKITPIPPGTELNKQPSKELKKNEPKETKNGPKEAKGLTKDSKNGTGEKKSTKETNGPSKVKEDQSNEEAGMNRINEYDDSFNQLDRNSGLAQNKNIRSSTPASRGASRRKEIKQHQAAVKIQAGARGYMERKRFKQRKAEMEAEKQEEQQQQQRQQQGKADQKKNLSEDDAATIVQASFKGYKTRKDLNLKKQQGQK